MCRSDGCRWLRQQGHDVVEAVELGPDPGDNVLLEQAAEEGRVFITLDFGFGELIFRQQLKHAGLIRLPDVPAAKRVEIMNDLLQRYGVDLEQGAILTVRSGRVRIARSDDPETDE